MKATHGWGIIINKSGSNPNTSLNCLINFPMFFLHRSLWLFHSKNTGPKTPHTLFVLFQFLVPPLSVFGSNLHVKSQHVWKWVKGVSKYAECVFQRKNSSCASLRLLSKKSKNFPTPVKSLKITPWGFLSLPNANLDMLNLSDKQLKVYKLIFPKNFKIAVWSLNYLRVLGSRELDFKHENTLWMRTEGLHVEFAPEIAYVGGF